MKNDIEIVRGTTVNLQVQITDANREPYLPGSETEKVYFGIKERPEDDEYIIHKTVSANDFGDGVCPIRLDPADTETLECKRYFYDVGIENSAGFFMVIELSSCRIKPNITKRGGA